MFCTRCGYNNKEGSQFCRKCGQKLAYVTNGGTTLGATMGNGSTLQGRYRIVKQLGKGGMGVVYLANDNRFSNRACVVKEMLEHLLDEGGRQKAVERFNQEADLLAAINHPNIPQVYDRFSEGNRHYLVMEFISGMDLKDILEEYMKNYSSPLPESDVAICFAQLCLTLKYIHEHRPTILHRDIKPANILLTKEGKAKLVDFGIAKTIQANTQGTGIGTQGYAAPEQYKGLADARTDLYALGATMHHLLTGRDPQKETPFDYPRVNELNNDVSSQMSDIIGWMLQMNMDSRPQNAGAVFERIKLVYPDIEQRILNYSAMDNNVAGIIAKKLESKEEFAEKNVCRFCGKENKLNSRFCTKCGKPIGSSISLNYTCSSAEGKMIVPEGSRILQNYPDGFGECIKVPDKTGGARLNVILEKCLIDGLEYAYITEKLPTIAGQEVFVYNIIRNAQGAMQYMRLVNDPLVKSKLYNHWQQLL